MLLTNGLKYHYARLWEGAKILPGREAAVHSEARRIVEERASYQDAAHQVEELIRLGVPWWLIACIHYREANLDFNRQILNGQPLDQVTTLWPAGMGPWGQFRESAVTAIDRALVNGWILTTEGPSWTAQEILFLCESWNGWGYMMYHPETPSPYLWEDTTVDAGRPGKYTSDGYFDPTADDKQVGIAALMLALAEAEAIAPLVVEDVGGGPCQDSLDEMGKAGRTFEVLGLQRFLNTLPHGRQRLKEDGICGPKTESVFRWLQYGLPF